MVLIPGLLQTADYAAAVFQSLADVRGTLRDTDEAVRARMLRQSVLLDDEQVIVETLHAEASTRDPADVALYNRVADALWSVAVTGDKARRLIQDAAHTLRERHSPGL